MAKAVFGEYAGYTTPGGVRYQKNNKLISVKAVPPEVVAYLNKQLGAEPKAPKFPKPSPEQLAKMREDSLKVPDELARSDAEMAAARPNEPIVTPSEPLTPEDFADPIPDDDTIEAVASAIPTQEVDPDFLESVSIHTASLQDIAEALSARFGIYTVYLRKLPVPDEINPLTGERFTKYHQGIAYQAAIRAQNQGILDRNPEQGRAQIENSRAASENFQVDPVAQTMGEARRQDTFAYRTSVRANEPTPATEIKHMMGTDGQMHAVQVPIAPGQTGEFNGASARYDKEEEEVIVEPSMGKQVIRPNW